jgi:isocitrate lyase
VGTGYFDRIATIVSGGDASMLGLRGSTEEAQFETAESPAPRRAATA